MPNKAAMVYKENYTRSQTVNSRPPNHCVDVLLHYNNNNKLSIVLGLIVWTVWSHKLVKLQG